METALSFALVLGALGLMESRPVACLHFVVSLLTGLAVSAWGGGMAWQCIIHCSGGRPELGAWGAKEVLWLVIVLVAFFPITFHVFRLAWMVASETWTRTARVEKPDDAIDG